MGSAGAIRAGRAYVEVSLDHTAIGAGLTAIQNRLRGWSTSLRTLGGSAFGGGLPGPLGAIAQFATSPAGVFAGLLMAGKMFATAGDELDKMASRVGASVEFLSALAHAAKIGGTDIAAMEVGIRRLQRTSYDASKGLSTAADAFRDLKINVYDSNGQLKTTEQLFMESASALSGLENNTKKAAIATVIFGRAGTTLLPMLREGSEGLVAVMDEAKKLGLVMSTEDATAAAQLTDALTRLTSALKMAAIRVGGALAPALLSLAANFTTSAKAAGEWIQSHGRLFTAALQGTATVLGLALAIKTVAVAMGLLTANPLVLALVAIAGAAAYASGAFQGWGASVREWKDTAGEALTKGDELRRASVAAASELERMSREQRLGATEMDRAQGVIDELTKAYGDLGVAVDRTTGKITGMAGAQEKLNAKMAEAAMADLRAAISGTQHELQLSINRLNDLFNKTTGLQAHGELFYGSYSAALAAETEKQAHLQSRLEMLLARLKGAKAGRAADILGGAGGPAEAEEMGPDKETERAAGDLKRKLADEANKRALDAIDDEEKRAIAAIRQKWNAELAAVQRSKAEKVAIAAAEAEEIEATKRRFEAERAKREAEQAQERARAQMDLDDELRTARINATMSGLARELALLDAERDKALRDARAQGLDEEKIKELYRLKAAGLAKGDIGGMVKTDVIGTFSGAALAGLGTGGGVQGKMEGHLARLVEKADLQVARLDAIVKAAGEGIVVGG